MLDKIDFIEAAKIIGCDYRIIMAVYEVEAAGRGYLDDGRVKILFEGHRFWKRLEKNGLDPAAFIKSYPEYRNVLYKNWDKKKYKGGASEWNRMSEAIEVCKMLNADVDIALKSASYGSFQIMGENCEMCGYNSAQEMISDYNLNGEEAQLNSFIKFVKSKKLDDELRAKNFQKFAQGYNGTAYRENKYDTKLNTAYNKFVKLYP